MSLCVCRVEPEGCTCAESWYSYGRAPILCRMLRQSWWSRRDVAALNLSIVMVVHQFFVACCAKVGGAGGI
ncbi:MAG: hypothetical protein JNL49_16625 [Bacteroidia bacterium]|nr:hypothetical protein [Bacteroidia bacterium]